MKCKAKTKDGMRCNKNALVGSKYCYGHQKFLDDIINIVLTRLNIIELKKYLRSQNPPKYLFRALIYLLVIGLIVVFTVIIKGYFDNQYNHILDNMRLKPDIELEVSPYLYDDAAFGEYLPLIITNIGDYTFRDVYVAFHSCGMPKGHYEQYRLPLIPAHSERTVPLANKDVVNKFKLGNCYPFAGENKSIPSFSISPSLRDGKNQTSIGCTYCHFNAKIYAGYYRNNKYEIFMKNISSYFYSPEEITMNVQ